MAVTHVFAGVAVTDYAAARAWYERLMGRAPDTLPNDNEAVWQLAPEGLIYVVGDAKRAGSGLLTLIVDDLDAHLAELAQRGIAVDAVKDMPGAGRKAAIRDPDGNTVTFAQPLSRG